MLVRVSEGRGQEGFRDVGNTIDSSIYLIQVPQQYLLAA